MKLSTLVISVLVVLLLASCASSYKPINPHSLVFDMKDNENVGFGYRYDVLTYRGNKKYAKREPKKHIRLVAVKIENRTDKPLKIGENYNIYAGQNLVFPIDSDIVHKELKQGTLIYLLYSLIWLNKTECDEFGNCQTTAIFPIGVPITVGNMVVAGSANKQFATELLSNSITTKVIAPGETAHAIIGIPDAQFQPLSIKLKESVASE